MKPTIDARSMTRNGDRTAADLLGQRPEDVPAVERQEREQVDDPQRQRDQREHADRLHGVELEALARGLIGADDAGDLAARLLVVEQPHDPVDGLRRDVPHPGHAELRRLGEADVDALAAEAEPDQQPLGAVVVARDDLERALRSVAQDDERDRFGRLAALARLAGAGVAADRVLQRLHAILALLRRQACGIALLAVDRHDPVAGLEHALRGAALLDALDDRLRVLHRP